MSAAMQSDLRKPVAADMTSAQPRGGRGAQLAAPAIPHPVRPAQAAPSARHDQANNTHTEAQAHDH